MKAMIDLSKIDKEHLEKQKLQAEIDEIKFRIKANKDQLESDKKKIFRMIPLSTLKTMSRSIPIALTILTGIVAIWIQFNQYLDKKEKEYEFSLNQVMVGLVAKLNSKDLAEREDATILLSAYEKNAIPILLWNLKTTETPESTIQSLKLIGEKESLKKDKVLDQLLESAKNVFDKLKGGHNINIQSITNYIMALGELGEQNEQKTIAILTSLKGQIEKNSKIGIAEKYAIRYQIKMAFNKFRSKL
jgi:hypothetical protein